MYRYTTPTITLTISNLNFSAVSVFRVAMQRGAKQLLREIPVDSDAVDAEAGTVTLELSQEETSAWSTGPVDIQVRAVLTSGRVLATNKASVQLEDVLDKVVV